MSGNADIDEMIGHTEIPLYSKFLNKEQKDYFFKTIIGRKVHSLYMRNNIDVGIISPDTKIKVRSNNEQLLSKTIKHFALNNIINRDFIEEEDWAFEVYITDRMNIPAYLYKEKIEHEIEHKEMSFLNDRAEGIYIWKQNEFLLIRKEKHIYIEGEQTDIVYQILRKAIRQIFTYELEVNNGFRLHSSAVAIENNSFAFLGDKGAGKTTTLLSLISHGNINYVTNDILEVRNKGNNIIVQGWPTVCLIGRGTLSALEKYSFLLPSQEFTNEKVIVEYNSIEEILDTKIVKDAHLNSIFFLELNLTSDQTDLSRLEWENGITETYKHIIKEDKDHPDWLLIRHKTESNVEINKALSDVNFFKLRIGNNLTEMAQKMSDFFEELVKRDVK